MARQQDIVAAKQQDADLIFWQSDLASCVFSEIANPRKVKRCRLGAGVGDRMR